ncbi:MAG TPA: serine/threonine-protein kinase [Actinomycetota bacterium]|nr:serine/threonine-protein kinase [Actinomycetota bacterium]
MSDRVVAERYHIDEALGRGGMGTVWRARDEVLKRMVALKEVAIPTNLTPEGREEVRERVIREARAAAKMSHPSAVTVYDVIEDGNHIFIAMELVEFPTLSDLVDQEGPFTPERAAKTGLAVLDALEVAHASGIVHRDVKPANIMVGEDRVKLADFGVASIKGDPRLTATGMVIGSPSYMSPEQATGQAADPATDLWGLGATLFFATEGHGPFDRPGPMPTLMAIANDEVPDAENAGPLKEVICSLLSKDPAKRPTGAELRPALATVAGNGSGPSGAVGEDESPDRTLKTMPVGGAALPPTLSDVPATPPIAEPAASLKEERKFVAPAAAAAAAPAAVREVVERRPVEPPPPELPPDARGGGNGWLVGAGVVALLLLAFFLVPRLLGGDPGPEEQQATESPAAPQAAPPAPQAEQPAPQPPPAPPAAAPQDQDNEENDSEGPAQSSAQAGSLPDGWRRSSLGNTGYSIGHPSNWRAVSNPLGDGSSMRFQASGSRYLLVDWTDQPSDDAVAAWEQQAPSFASRHQNYREIRIEETQFQDFDTAAIWEWTYTERGAQLHAINLGFADEDYGFALNFQTRASEWEQYEDTFEQFQETFGTAD